MMQVFELTVEEQEQWTRRRAEHVEANRVAQEAYEKSIAAGRRVQVFNNAVAGARNITMGTVSGQISECGKYIYGYVYGPAAE